MSNEHAVVSHWRGGFEERALQKWAEQLRGRLTVGRVTLGLVFASPQFFQHATQVLEILRVHAQIPLLAGCSSSGLIAGAEEIEEQAGLVLGLFSLPGAEIQAHRFTQEGVEESQGQGPGYWTALTGVKTDQTNGWLVFADPFHLDSDSWLKSWNEAYAPLPILGGLASGDYTEQRTQVYWNGDVFEEGGIAISFGGEVKLASVISQGCTPIGETWTITKAERNLIHQIGNRPAYEVLIETFEGLSAADQKRTRGNLFVGLVINEYLEDFHRGDFLIRNLIGADPKTGILSVGAFPRMGQTIQFQRRDAAAASEDMTALLESTRQRLDGATIYGGCLCSCNGRGHRLFGSPSHDAGKIHEHLGPLGLAGFFCNGELGPVGDRNFLHGYTASLALFLKK
jgi:small ligand-binding sensory domain FIST